MKGRIVGIINTSKRSGYSQKTKKDWNIMEVEVEAEDGAIIKADTFDTVADGDIVELEENHYTGNDGKQYRGWNAKVPRTSNFGPKGATSTDDILAAVRMVFREVKVMARDVKDLKGLDEPESPQEPVVVPVEDSEPPMRPWENVGHARADDPLPEPPGDLESFMNQ